MRWLLPALLAATLTACVHSADVHCDLRDGKWTSSGAIGSESLPDATPGI